MVKKNSKDLKKLKILTAIIDYMYYKATKKIYSETFVIFLTTFVLPFMISSFSENELVKTTCK
jgi:hypothetical protein